MRYDSIMKIALVTAERARALDDDLPPLESALRGRSAVVSIPDWDDPTIEWNGFDIVLLRSPWDYTTRLTEFLSWAERVSTQTTLLNPFPVIQWNTDKHYLADLADAGVATVPSTFVEPGESPQAAISDFLRRHTDAEFVVKPAVGAGSRDAQRYEREEYRTAIAHIQRLLDAHRSVLLQPYLGTVDEVGETALIYFAGQFSHAIRKGALLRRGEEPTAAVFAPEKITHRIPSTEELHLGRQILAAMPFGTLPYARIDLLRDTHGAPCVLELELTEPSLFLAYREQAAERFAEVVLSNWSP